MIECKQHLKQEVPERTLPASVGNQFLVFVLFISLLVKSELGIGQSYVEYHRMISAAEEYYFLENNVDSSLSYYQSCFESFDFVFARDAVNAFQIAFRENRSIEYFLKISFESGVTPSVLSSIPALSDFTNDSLPKLDVMQDYALFRSHYLDRIDVECLNETYRLGIIDQITKSIEGKHETDALFKLALRYGLPGERNCGIEDSEIHQELGNRATNFLRLRDSISDARGKNMRYYSLNNNSLSMHVPLVIMLHNDCTYKYYEKALREAYLGGFIHPREIGCIYDNTFLSDQPHCRIVPNRGVFGLNRFANSNNVDTEMANHLRSEWEICSIETDLKKEELEDQGFKFVWDYW